MDEEHSVVCSQKPIIGPYPESAISVHTLSSSLSMILFIIISVYVFVCQVESSLEVFLDQLCVHFIFFLC
jgi:hypothetical protein